MHLCLYEMQCVCVNERERGVCGICESVCEFGETKRERVVCERVCVCVCAEYNPFLSKEFYLQVIKSINSISNNLRLTCNIDSSMYVDYLQKLLKQNSTAVASYCMQLQKLGLIFLFKYTLQFL